MTFTFRHRIELAHRGVINLDVPVLPLTDSNEQASVTLNTGRSGRALREATRVTLLGSGYSTEDQASEAGLTWRSVLERVFAYGRVGADFGDRTAKGVITKSGIRMFEEASGGRRHLNDDHGLMVYESEPVPQFVRAGAASMFVSISEDRLRRVVTLPESRVPTTTKESTAFDLFSASFRTGGIADARFMLLMMALETLIDQEPRDEATTNHIETLIASTRHADLPDQHKMSIIGSLETLRVESIRQAGKRLLGALEDRNYGGLSPSELFTRCYSVRSDLVHGNMPRPSSQEVGSLGASLEVMVSHLIAGPFLVKAMDRELDK